MNKREVLGIKSVGQQMLLAEAVSASHVAVEHVTLSTHVLAISTLLQCTEAVSCTLNI